MRRGNLLPTLTVVWLAASAAIALVRYPTAYDFWNYHLYAALSLYHRTTYHPLTMLAWVDGYPPLAHAVQGLLILSTGRTEAASLVGMIGFLLMLIGFQLAVRELRRTLWLALLCLCLPLVAIHLVIPYVDLFTASFLTIAVFAATDPRTVDAPVAVRALLVVGSGAAAAAKMQAWPILTIVLPIALVMWMWRKRNRTYTLVTFILAASLAGLWPMRNLVRHGNPTYPLARSPGASRFTVNLDPDPATYTPGYLTNMPRPIVFAASVLELGRLAEPSLYYSGDMWRSPLRAGYASPNQNMGGFGPWNVILIAAWYVYFARRNRVGALRLAAIFGPLILFVACLPHSHELRYWLVLPMAALACLLRDAPEFLAEHRRAVFACIAFSLIVNSVPVFFEPMKRREDVAPRDALQFWQSAQRDKEYFVHRPPYSIFWTGPDFNSFHVTERLSDQSP